MIFDRLLDPDMPAPLVWFVLVWLFAVGACIGSFINVVIYRLPAGLSLLHPPSRCPACETPIRATDNVPIFGWIWLRGRCRHCRASISARYPAVELLVALLFLGLAWVELLSPNSQPVEDGQTLAQWWGVYAYHLFLLCSLICAAFIEYDGHALPARLTVPTLIVGLGAPMIWPYLRPLSAIGGNPVLDGLVGVAAGAALGLATRPVWPHQIGPPQRATFRDPVVILACTGSFLGWQAASGVGAGAAPPCRSYRRGDRTRWLRGLCLSRGASLDRGLETGSGTATLDGSGRRPDNMPSRRDLRACSFSCDTNVPSAPSPFARGPG
jgi:leader peptidase (prepilin peptidase)/N-methyltransferase